MKKKLFLYYMILVIIGISVTGFFISALTQRLYKKEVEDKLKNAAMLIEYQITQSIIRNENIDYNQLAKNYAKALNPSVNKNDPQEKIYARVTFIDFFGNVVGESEADYQSMENHLNRKEIQQAIKGNPGEDVRFSKTLNMDFLYVAIPIESSSIVLRISTPLVQLKKIDELIWNYDIIGILAGLIFTVALAFKFSSSIIRPIHEFISVSRDISNGNYSKRVSIVAHDELGQLAETFNEMAEKLQKTVEDLTDRNVQFDTIMNSMTDGIVAVDSGFRIIMINSIACGMFNVQAKTTALGINIMELIRNNHINTFLKETMERNVSLVNEAVVGFPEDKVLRVYTSPIKAKHNEEKNSGGVLSIQDITNIKKLEQIRTEFVSNVTHELKTPLTSIRGFIETLKSGAIDDKEVSVKFLEIIDIEAERLYMLISDILQLSEIETRQKDINIANYDLKSIIDDTLPILQSAADKNSITILNEAHKSISITANKDRIKQMIINLVDNAIKYNVENGSVYIRAYKTEGKIVISVKDTGIGIDSEHLSRIFERFYRVDKGRSRNMGGTGLGLSIVKHVVNLYNGDISVNSEPGKGTEFIIQLPM